MADLHETTSSHATSLRQAYDMNCFSLMTALYVKNVVRFLKMFLIATKLTKLTYFVTNCYRVGDEGEVFLRQNGGRSCCGLIHLKSFLKKY